jgi:NitT/TauT family transport system ATP-binding protein
MLEVSAISKTYSSDSGLIPAVGSVDFSVGEHEFVSVVGPSGCGKTTLLRCMAGLMSPTTGHAALHGRVIADTPPEFAVIFQEYNRSLFPWMTVRRNVELPARRKLGERRGREVAEATLRAVGLAEFVQHYPWQLSGGMQQRTAIARALAYQPEVLLMDEPFASVDAQTRADLEDLVLRVRAEFGVTCVLVTHDIDESVYMSDRVVVLSSRPSRVRAVVDIDLPRPRSQIGTRDDPAFAHLRTSVYRMIQRSALAAAANQEDTDE